jgi:hypothetical protein
MLLLLVLLLCSPALSASQVSVPVEQTNFTLTRKKSSTPQMLTIVTTLKNNRSESFRVETQQAGVHTISGGMRTTGRYASDAEEQAMRMIFAKAKEKYFSENGSYVPFEVTFKAPDTTYHFNRTDLPDETGTPIGELSGEKDDKETKADI